MPNSSVCAAYPQSVDILNDEQCETQLSNKKEKRRSKRRSSRSMTRRSSGNSETRKCSGNSETRKCNENSETRKCSGNPETWEFSGNIVTRELIKKYEKREYGGNPRTRACSENFETQERTRKYDKRECERNTRTRQYSGSPEKQDRARTADNRVTRKCRGKSDTRDCRRNSKTKRKKCSEDIEILTCSKNSKTQDYSRNPKSQKHNIRNPVTRERSQIPSYIQAPNEVCISLSNAKDTTKNYYDVTLSKIFNRMDIKGNSKITDNKNNYCPSSLDSKSIHQHKDSCVSHSDIRLDRTEESAISCNNKEIIGDGDGGAIVKKHRRISFSDSESKNQYAESCMSPPKPCLGSGSDACKSRKSILKSSGDHIHNFTNTNISNTSDDGDSEKIRPDVLRFSERPDVLRYQEYPDFLRHPEGPDVLRCPKRPDVLKCPQRPDVSRCPELYQYSNDGPKLNGCSQQCPQFICTLANDPICDFRPTYTYKYPKKPSKPKESTLHMRKIYDELRMLRQKLKKLRSRGRRKKKRKPVMIASETMTSPPKDKLFAAASWQRDNETMTVVPYPVCRNYPLSQSKSKSTNKRNSIIPEDIMSEKRKARSVSNKTTQTKNVDSGKRYTAIPLHRKTSGAQTIAKIKTDMTQTVDVIKTCNRPCQTMKITSKDSYCQTVYYYNEPTEHNKGIMSSMGKLVGLTRESPSYLLNKQLLNKEKQLLKDSAIADQQAAELMKEKKKLKDLSECQAVDPDKTIPSNEKQKLAKLADTQATELLKEKFNISRLANSQVVCLLRKLYNMLKLTDFQGIGLLKEKYKLPKSTDSDAIGLLKEKYSMSALSIGQTIGVLKDDYRSTLTDEEIITVIRKKINNDELTDDQIIGAIKRKLTNPNISNDDVLHLLKKKYMTTLTDPKFLDLLKDKHNMSHLADSEAISLLKKELDVHKLTDSQAMGLLKEELNLQKLTDLESMEVLKKKHNMEKHTDSQALEELKKKYELQHKLTPSQAIAFLKENYDNAIYVPKVEDKPPQETEQHSKRFGRKRSKEKTEKHPEDPCYWFFKPHKTKNSPICLDCKHYLQEHKIKIDNTQQPSPDNTQISPSRCPCQNSKEPTIPSPCQRDDSSIIRKSRTNLTSPRKFSSMPNYLPKSSIGDSDQYDTANQVKHSVHFIDQDCQTAIRDQAKNHVHFNDQDNYQTAIPDSVHAAGEHEEKQQPYTNDNKQPYNKDNKQQTYNPEATSYGYWFLRPYKKTPPNNKKRKRRAASVR